MEAIITWLGQNFGLAGITLSGTFLFFVWAQKKHEAQHDEWRAECLQTQKILIDVISKNTAAVESVGALITSIDHRMNGHGN